MISIPNCLDKAQSLSGYSRDEEPLGIKVSNASLAYNDQKIFTDLCFSAESGEFTSILGPSGVGKTTLLKLIAGQCDCASAIITDQYGTPLNNRIAWMAQNDLLLPWLTVLENVCLGARLRGEIKPKTKAAIYDKARDLLKIVGLDGVENKRPDTLSGGMRQRAALARTLIEDRPIILMDEPFSAVDPLTRISLQNLAANILKGRTVILVTHDPLEALRLGHNVFVLNGQPATLKSIALPEIPCPRPINAPEILKAQADILLALTPNDHNTQQQTDTNKGAL